MELTLSYDSFTTIPYTTGTIQNLCERATIEIGTTGTQNAGLVLYPGEKYEFKNKTVYARAKWDAGEVVRCAVESIVSAAGSASTTGQDITIPTTGWTSSGVTDYPYTCTITVSGVTSDMIPDIIFSIDNLDELADCGFSTACESTTNGIIVYAQSVPASAIPATLKLTTV